MRPLLFPLFLRVAATLGIKMSIAAFFVNAGSLVFFVWYAGGRQKLFSAKNSILLAGFFLLPALWSFSGAKLTESILPAVEIGVFVLLTEIFLPQWETSIGMIVLYSVVITLLSIMLKPWIMFFTLGSAVLLLAAGLFLRSFRFARMPALILLVVGLFCYGLNFKYSLSKSPMSGNMVLLLSSDDKEADLRERLQLEKDPNSPSAVMFRDMLADIELVKGRYHGDPFEVPPAQFKLLRFTDPNYTDRIKQAFVRVYFSRPRDIIGLAGLGLSRYSKAILLGWRCLQANGAVYGPSLPWFNPVGGAFVFLLLVTGAVYLVLLRKKEQQPDRKANPVLLIYSVCLFISGVLFALFLCLTGGTELTRTVEPAIFFQLLVLVFYFSTSIDRPSHFTIPVAPAR